MIVSKRDDRPKKQNPDKPSEVLALIEECRRNQAPDLDLSQRGLTKLPESIGKLTQLQDLNLSENRLTGLPEFIGKLTQLETLDLMSNQLTKLPESIGKLTQLNKVLLYNNQLIEQSCLNPSVS
jgi:Leucine-rich repeat (LRR) protein